LARKRDEWGRFVHEPRTEIVPVEADAETLVRIEAERAKWKAVRFYAENGKGTIAQICERHGITKRQYQTRFRNEGWALRRAPALASRATLVSRMFNVLDVQLGKLEAKAASDEASGNEVALLGSLANTLGKLRAFDGPRDAPTELDSEAMLELRIKIARRIEQLNQG
jgi:transposase-like protein